MNMASKKNIYLIFGALMALLVLFAFVLVNQAVRIKWHSTEIETNWLPSIEAINAMQSAVGNVRSNVVGHILANDESLKAEYAQKITSFDKGFIEGKAKYVVRVDALKEKALWKQYNENYDDYMAATKQVIVMSQNNEKEKALNQIKINQNLYDSVTEYAQLIVDLNSSAAYEEAKTGNQVYESAKIELIAGLIIILSSFIVIAFSLSNGSIKQQDTHAVSKIKKNILLTFFTLSLAIIAYGFLNYQQLNRVNEQINQLKNKWLPSIEVIHGISSNTISYEILQKLSLVTTNLDEKLQLENSRKLIAEDVDKLRKKFSNLISTDVERDLYDQFSVSFDEYALLSQEIEELAHHNEIDKALIEEKQSVILKNDFSEKLAELFRLNERGSIATSSKNDATLDALKTFNLGGVTLLVLMLTIAAQLLQFWLLDEGHEDKFEEKTGFTLTIKLKLRLVFFGILAAFILFSLLINGLMQELNDGTNKIEKSWLPNMIKVNQINKMVSDYRVAVTRYVFATEAEEKLYWDKTRKNLIKKIAYSKASYEGTITSDLEHNIYQDFAHNYADYVKKSEVMLALSSRNETAAALKVLRANGLNFNEMTGHLEKLVQLNSEGGVDAAQLNNQLFKLSQQIIYVVVLIILMITILFMIIFDKNISLAIQRLTSSVRSLAAGVLVSGNTDLKERQDEIGQMANAVDMVKETIQALTIDATELIHTAEDSLDSSLSGMSAARIDNDRHPGEFKKIVLGMNNLIDLMSKPLSGIAEIMQNLALGDLSGRMQGDYAGELHTLKANVNRSLDGLVGLLTELSQTLQYMANNDLTHQLTGNYQGEFSLLKASTNQAIGHMVEILQEITISTSQSAVAIAQTSESSKYVADEASQQMLAIENVSKTIDDTADSVGEIARKAQEGSQLACSTANFANDGQIQLNKLIELIQHIDAEYVRIEKITDEITRIADKTHLLSLNAGLEAMRAGDYGLGFGFVAQQIGALAEEVTSSANSIGTVINSSGQKIRLGVHAMQETQAVMAKIAQAAEASEINVQSISVAIVQQSSAVKTITERVNELRVSSGATASAAEEISSTMNHLAQTVKETADKVKRFKLNEN